MTRTPATLCKRLWLGGGAIGLFVFTLAAAGPFFDRSGEPGKLGMGYDFLPAYVAGHFARTGEFAKVYDRVAFSGMQTRVIREEGLEMDGRYGAGLNPPHFALLFAPLSALPYRTAVAVWLALNVAMLAAALTLLIKMPATPAEPAGTLRPCCGPDHSRWKTAGLVPLLVLASMPFCQAMGHQQNTFLSLLLLCVTVTLWRGGWLFAAGVACGLLFYKPQVALVIALVLALDGGRRAVLGLGVAGVATLLLTLWLMPGALEEYARTLPLNVEWIQNRLQYNWGRQATFQGFWRLLLQGRETGATSAASRALWWASAGAVLGAFSFVFVRTRRDAVVSRDRVIAASIACTPLLIPYFMDYDLLLLAVPAVLYAADVMRAGESAVDRWTVRAWVALYLWAYLNPGVSGVVRVSLAVPLLAAVATGLMLRCLRPAEKEAAADAPEAPRRAAPLARAA